MWSTHGAGNCILVWMYRPDLLVNFTVCAVAALCTATLAQAEEPLSAEEDHARMMQVLGIDSLRRGADGDPDSPNAANYDEALANGNLHSLPDPLVLDSGAAVVTADDWWQERRPQIVEHFEREIYGRVPDDAPQVRWTIDSTEPGTLGGRPVTRYALTGHAEPVRMAATLTVPEAADGPVPAVLQLTVGPEFLARLRERFTEEQLAAFRGPGPPWQEQVIERGWAAVELVATSVQADDGDGLAAGVIGLGNGGAPRDPDDWGALRAWAWGASRVLDFLEGFGDVDASRVAIQGHSRYGKAALVAMAFDPRFATGFISSSGEGGAKLWRRNYGEQIGNIAGSGEYHWVAGNFLKYAGPLTANDLPVDAHQLIALCAPRPVFISSGTDGDQWVDPRGMFLAAVHAGPVYRLLGRRDLGTADYPAIGTALTHGEIAWRQHELGHTPGPNWRFFLDFAARYFDN